MGLDFSHGKAHWSYSGFNNFRRAIARDRGIELDEMKGFKGIKEWDTSDPLYEFLYHSDCDGELTVEQMKIIEPELRAAVERLPENNPFDYLDKKRGIELCDEMAIAIEKNESLIFC